MSTREGEGLEVRWRRGDPAAASEVYELYYDDVYALARVALRNHDDAEDVTQQIFTKAIEARGRWDPAGSASLRTWLLTVARNTAIDHLRRRGRLVPEEPARVADRADADVDLGGPANGTSLSSFGDVELEIFLGRLPHAQRVTLVLRYLLDLKPAEVAVATGKSVRAVYDLERRGLRTLERYLVAVGRGKLDARRLRRRRMSTLIRIKPLPVLGARRFAIWSSGRPWER